MNYCLRYQDRELLPYAADFVAVDRCDAPGWLMLRDINGRQHGMPSTLVYPRDEESAAHLAEVLLGG